MGKQKSFFKNRGANIPKRYVLGLTLSLAGSKTQKSRAKTSWPRVSREKDFEMRERDHERGTAHKKHWNHAGPYFQEGIVKA
jgi:hypothetical protein